MKGITSYGDGDSDGDIPDLMVFDIKHIPGLDLNASSELLQHRVVIFCVVASNMTDLKCVR